MHRYFAPLFLVCATIVVAPLATSNAVSAAVLVTGTELVTNVYGLGTVTQDTYAGAAVINPSNTLVASQNGILTYQADRGGDPFPTSTFSVEKMLRVSLLVDSTPVLLKDPKFVWDFQHTNTGGNPQYFFKSLAEMTLDVAKFLDANSNNVYDNGETVVDTGIGAAYIISGLDDADDVHASGAVIDLGPYGTGIVETLLNPDTHYVLFLRYGLSMDAPDISSDPLVASIQTTFDALDPKYLGPQWTFNLLAVPEPGTLALAAFGALGLLIAARRKR